MDSKAIGIHIGQKFQEFRKKNNLTQYEVAEITGLQTY